MINLSGIKHLSFDLWLTLIRSHRSFKRERSNLLKKHFDVQQEDDTVFDIVSRYDRLFNTINETTGGNIETFEIIMMILDQLSVDVRTIKRVHLQDFYEAMEEKFFEFPPELLNDKIAGYLLQTRQSGFTASILSNTAFIKGSTLRKFLEKINLSGYFRFQLYSDEMGYSKPNSWVFDKLFEQARRIRSISRTEIMHIGDNHNADYEGALNAGFQAYLIKSQENDWHFSHKT